MPVTFRDASCDRKLSPVEFVQRGVLGARLSPVARPPYCSSTYVSIAATCPQSCAFKSSGCYVREGFTGSMSRKLDRDASRMTGDMVVMIEAERIKAAFRGGTIPQDGARGGRDLRLHVGGDVSSSKAARWLAAAAAHWKQRGGGSVWTYTHRWRQIPRQSWGSISALASVENLSDAYAALTRGYAPAFTMRQFPSEKSFALGTLKVVPCPAETRGTTCVKCRLCVDDRRLAERGVAIGFALHGQGASAAARRLPVI